MIYLRSSKRAPKPTKKNIRLGKHPDNLICYQKHPQVSDRSLYWVKIKLLANYRPSIVNHCMTCRVTAAPHRSMTPTGNRCRTDTRTSPEFHIPRAFAVSRRHNASRNPNDSIVSFKRSSRFYYVNPSTSALRTNPNLTIIPSVWCPQ